MNKEEMFKNLSDKDKKEVLSLMSFMKKFKEQERKKELYATYEEYLDLIHISEHLNDENESLQSQLQAYKDKEDKLREIFNDYDAGQVPSGLSQCTYEITVEEMQKIQQILNEGE
jgi:cellulose biosynthesis protein BcsQ